MTLSQALRTLSEVFERFEASDADVLAVSVDERSLLEEEEVKATVRVTVPAFTDIPMPAGADVSPTSSTVVADERIALDLDVRIAHSGDAPAATAPASRSASAREGAERVRDVFDRGDDADTFDRGGDADASPPAERGPAARRLDGFMYVQGTWLLIAVLAAITLDVPVDLVYLGWFAGFLVTATVLWTFVTDTRVKSALRWGIPFGVLVSGYVLLRHLVDVLRIS